MTPQWLIWARQIQAIAQNGLAYAKDPFDIITHHSEADFDALTELLKQEVGYATPKIDLRAAVFHKNAILLVKEREDGLWTLPGGWADINESLSEGVVREVFEESGYYTRAIKLLAAYDRDKHPHPPFLYHTMKLFFRCELLGGKPTNSIETTDVGFFRESKLPPLSLSRVTPEQLTRMFEHYHQPDLPTDFD